MDQQEWMGYVSRLANGEYPVPVGMIQDYNDWRCRSIVGRRLALPLYCGACAVLDGRH